MLPFRVLPFALPALALLAAVALSAPASAQQTDHLACMKVQHKPTTPDAVPVAISDIIEDSFSECVVKKVKMASLCIRVAKDGADDPIAGQSAAEAYTCYKVKCGTGKPDGSLSVEDQFGSHFVTRKSLLTLCAPADTPVALP
jgi:hypothetical protein